MLVTALKDAYPEKFPRHSAPLSVFDIFSIGIGPSSSHTVGPMRAARAFLLNLGPKLSTIKTITITLHGSLAFTGKGHGTHKALLMGLEGEKPENINPDTIPARLQNIYETHHLTLLRTHSIQFDPEKHLIFDFKKELPGHSNAMQFRAYNPEDKIIDHAIYYSIGGGFIVTDAELNSPTQANHTLPYPFNTGNELFGLCKQHQCTVKDIILANEKSWREENAIKEGLLHIGDIMKQCIEKGCDTEGVLEGELKVQRRAPGLFKKLKSTDKSHAKHDEIMNWLNLFAMAVNEENAAGGRVVTAPTNGAAGIIPAVLNYYLCFCEGTSEGIVEFLLTAGAIGMLYKKNASISGAEMGCQGEVGVACSMAAGALAAVLGGTMTQVENAAEIGMEHNLGLTCDPVGGRVQIPCIERNAMGAVKAVNAARLALAENSANKVSLDMVINTMREIGQNMNSMYKETSKGGLAVNVIEC